LLALAAFVITILVVSVWPFRLIPAFLHVDAILHASMGAAITLTLAAIVPRRDDILAVITGVLGIIWEPIEWYWFDCIQGSACTQASLVTWMVGEDTVFDMALVALGAIIALIVIGRYR